MGNNFQILNLCLKNIMEFIEPIWGKKNMKFKEKEKQIKYILDVMEVERNVRSKASKNIQIKNITMKIQRENYQEKINGEYMSKFRILANDYENQLKRKFWRKENILRCIKEISIKQDKQWENNDGCNGRVQKYFATYKICIDFSINTLSNVEIIRRNSQLSKLYEKKEAQTQQGDGNSSNEATHEQKEVTSYLVKKFPENLANDQSFLTEKTLLAIMRGEKCYSINSFYCLQSTGIQNLKYIYSDYHSRKIDHQFGKIKYYLKILLSLCEGLVFLRWTGIIHRDLKPDNILLSHEYIAKIIDFGSGFHNKYFKKQSAKLLMTKILSNQLRTNARYNLRYSVLHESLKQIFFRDQFEQHAFFDVYPFGLLIEELICNDLGKMQLGTQVYELFHLLAQLCQQPNPDDRPDPKDFYVLFGEILRLNQL